MYIHFFIFRHGQTDWNQQLRLQGQMDIPINSTGEAQAKALIPILSVKSLDLLMASTLQRAVQTATIIGAALHIPVVTDSRLVEINFGGVDGTTFQDFIEEYGEAYFQRVFMSVADEDMDIPTLAETKRQAQTRTMQALTDIALHSAAKTVGIACHGFIMTLIAGFASSGQLFKFGNGDLLHISYENSSWHYLDIHRQNA